MPTGRGPPPGGGVSRPRLSHTSAIRGESSPAPGPGSYFRAPPVKGGSSRNGLLRKSSQPAESWPEATPADENKSVMLSAAKHLAEASRSLRIAPDLAIVIGTRQRIA